MRLFFALELPSGVQQSLSMLREAFGAHDRILRWSATERLHITLVFLGEVDPGQLPELRAAMRGAVEGVPPFTLQTQKLGVFPNERRPRVLWVGLGPQSGLAHVLTVHAALLRELPRAMVGRGASVFTPHITLARVAPKATPDERGRFGTEVHRRGISSPLPSYMIPGDDLTLMESRQGAGGHRYFPVERVAFVSQEQSTS